MDLKEKIVVITGSTSGLGKALAEAFNREGAKVIVSSRNEDETNAIAAAMDAFGVPADVTKEEDVKKLVDETVEKFRRIDIWINNAGIWIPHGPIEDLDMARVRQMFEVNLFGTMNGTKAVLPLMRKQNSGIVINILSTSALSGRAGSSAYCASKYGAAGFTKSLQAEIQGSGVRAIAVYPGGMQTHLFDEKKPGDIDQYMQPSFVAGKILENLKADGLQEEIIIKRLNS